MSKYHNFDNKDVLVTNNLNSNVFFKPRLLI